MPGSFPRRRHSEGTPPLSPDVTRGHPPAVPLPQPHPSVAEQGGVEGWWGGMKEPFRSRWPLEIDDMNCF